MSPTFPSFSDLGRDCRDLFKKGHDLGIVQMIVKSGSCPGLEVKSTYPQWLTTTGKWDIYNKLSLAHQLNTSGQATLQGKVNHDTNNKYALLNLQHQHPRFTLDGNVSGGDLSSVIVGASIVSGLGGIIAGYKVDYDISAGQLTSNNIALGIQTKDYGMLLTYENLNVLNGSYFYRVNRNLEVGVQYTLLRREEEAQCSVGGKFTFSGSGHSVRAVVNNQRVLGLELGLKILEGFRAFASSDIDLKTFSAGNHGVLSSGLGFELGN